MAAFAVLGMKAADVLIDKHFEKIPDKVIDPHTYTPKNISRTVKNRHRNRRPSSTHSPAADEDYYRDRRDSDDVTQSSGRGGREQDYGYGPDEVQYIPPPAPAPYSNELPHLRPQYVPSPPPPPVGTQGGYYPPPQFSHIAGEQRGRNRYDDYRSESPPPRRPQAVTRRSSSHPARNRDNYYYDDSDSDSGRQLAHRPRRRGSNPDIAHRIRDGAHRYGVKEEISNQFTGTKEGLAGSALGAVVGGWAAQKAQVASGRRDKRGHASSGLTLLGAVVGGLAANTVIDKWEDRKRETAEKEDKWEDKFDGDRSRSGRSSRRRDSRESRGRRYDDDYDDKYRR